MKKRFSSGIGAKCECICHQRLMVIAVIVLIHMQQEAVERK